MIAWWWIPIVLIIGACLGAMIMGVCAYDNAKGRKRWWEE